MRTTWRMVVLLALVLASAPWDVVGGQDTRWRRLGTSVRDGTSIWMDTRTLWEVTAERRQGWFERRYGTPKRDSSRFEADGTYRPALGLGWRYFVVARTRSLVRADCREQRLWLLTWMHYDATGALLLSDRDTTQPTAFPVTPESEGELEFEALCEPTSGGR